MWFPGNYGRVQSHFFIAPSSGKHVGGVVWAPMTRKDNQQISKLTKKKTNSHAHKQPTQLIQHLTFDVHPCSNCIWT